MVKGGKDPWTQGAGALGGRESWAQGQEAKGSRGLGRKMRPRNEGGGSLVREGVRDQEGKSRGFEEGVGGGLRARRGG